MSARTSSASAKRRRSTYDVPRITARSAPGDASPSEPVGELGIAGCIGVARSGEEERLVDGHSYRFEPGCDPHRVPRAFETSLAQRCGESARSSSPRSVGSDARTTSPYSGCPGCALPSAGRPTSSRPRPRSRPPLGWRAHRGSQESSDRLDVERLAESEQSDDLELLGGQRTESPPEISSTSAGVAPGGPRRSRARLLDERAVRERPFTSSRR